MRGVRTNFWSLRVNAIFPLTKPNTNVNSLKKEKESLKSEIAALKKNFDDFQNSLKLSVNDANVSNNGGEASRPAISQDETLNTLQFYGKSYDDLRQEAHKSLQQLWARLNVLSKRVEEIGKSIELIQRYSYQYNVKIVGLPEIKASESASDTTTLCLSLFQAAGVEISIQDTDIVHRIPTRNATSSLRPVVCKFTRRIAKEKVMNVQKDACEVSLSFGGKPIQQSKITKFLGVYIDDHLTWKHHISYVCKQIAKSIGIIFRSRFFLSSTTKLTLYYTLIYPYIVYCNCAWSSTYVSNLNRIYYLQKRAVRAITNSDYQAHSLLYSPN